MKVFFVPMTNNIYGNSDQAIQSALCNFKLPCYEKVLGAPVLSEHYHYGETSYRLKIAVFNERTQKLTIRYRTIKVAKVEPTNEKKSVEYLGVQL